MTDRQERFSGTMDVRQAHQFDPAALQAYMQQHVDGFSGDLVVEQFKGGQSNPTYKLTAGGKSYVMRRKPPGKLLPSAHAVDREYKVITALAKAGVPVPQTYALCTDDEVVGTWFYIMDCVEGRIFWEPTLPGLGNAERGAIYDAMNAVVAKLHTVDFAAVGLDDFGKPGNYFARQISRWTKQYQASETETIEAMDNLIAWLPENIPAGDETSIVHGDYRLDNMIFAADQPKVLAVLDWELATLGHPLGDFSYHLMPWRLRPDTFNGLAGVDLAALGIPTEEEYVAAYCRRTGRDGIADLDFYLAYNMFRLAGILQGIMGRVVDGTAASRHAIESGKLARPIAEQGWALVERILAR